MRRAILGVAVALFLLAPSDATAYLVTYEFDGTFSLKYGTDFLQLNGGNFNLDFSVDSNDLVSQGDTGQGWKATDYQASFSLTLSGTVNYDGTYTGTGGGAFLRGEYTDSTADWMELFVPTSIPSLALYIKVTYTPGVFGNLPYYPPTVLSSNLSGTAEYNFGKTFYDLIISSADATVEPIPEPATMLLLASGLVGLAGVRRKFRKS